MTENEKIILIGAGNVAHHLAPAMLRAGMNLCQVYSRTWESARRLGMRTGVAYTAEAGEVYPDGDIYIFCVSDDSLPQVAKSVRLNRAALLLHTSGCLPMDALRPFGERYGVVYPVQTFSQRRELDFRLIPLCVEGCTPAVVMRVKAFAAALSGTVREVDSRRRRELHLAAVFVNNFPNYLYSVGRRLMEECGLPFAMLRPLIAETADKVMRMEPEEAQTGPARRGDESVMAAHRALLRERKEWLKIYALLSEGIRSLYAGRGENGGCKEEGGAAVEMPTLW